MPLIWLFYPGALLVGVALLALDLAGRFVVRPERLRWWRGIALVAVLVLALGPLALALAGRYAEPNDVFRVVVAGYTVGGLLFATGIVAGTRTSGAVLRRIGYVLLLAAGLVPGWILIAATPTIALIGIGLARPAAEQPAPHRAHP